MRNFTLLLLFLVPFSLSAVTKTSIANGSWSNPTIWSPAGVPGPGDDITVNTAVTFNQNISFGMQLFHITLSGSLIDMGSDSIMFGGDVFLIEGYLSTSVLSVGAVDSVVNRSQIEVNELIQSGVMYNYNWICTAVQVMTSDNFINNGSVKTDMWVNSGVVTGNGGQFCIAGNFINTDQISGNIDICDASPGGFGDVNTGTISGSVTNCAAGPCPTCLLPGYPEYYQPSGVAIVPNPVVNVSTLVFEHPQMDLGTQNNLVITDVAGREIKRAVFTGRQATFDRTGLQSGMYFFSVISNGETIVASKILVE